jgi:hypothetical protein
MNERIKQLAMDAGFYYDITDELVISSEAGNSGDLILFANLIIKECAGLFPLQFTDEQYQRRIDKTIKNHFDIA